MKQNTIQLTGQRPRMARNHPHPGQNETRLLSGSAAGHETPADSVHARVFARRPNRRFRPPSQFRAILPSVGMTNRGIVPTLAPVTTVLRHANAFPGLACGLPLLSPERFGLMFNRRATGQTKNRRESKVPRKTKGAPKRFGETILR